MKGERTVEKRRERNTKKTLLDIYSKYGIILILILIMAFLTIRTGGTFIGKNNLLNILKQIACIGVLACGQTAVIIAGGMDLSVGSIVTRGGEPVLLTPKEFDLLLLFVQNRNIALFRETIYERVWGAEFTGDSRTVDLHVQRLRRKLGWQGKLLTIYKTGYRLEVTD